MSQKLLSRNKNGMLHMKLHKRKGCEKKNPGFESENQMQSSGSLTAGYQTEMCFNCTLQCLSYYLSHGKRTSSSVLTIAWKDSVKTTLGWYLTRLRVLAWLCRKEIAIAVVYVWLMKGIFTLNPSAAKCFLSFTFPWQGLFNSSAGFVIPKRVSLFPKWSSFLNGCEKTHIKIPGGIFLSPNDSKWRS